MKLKAKQLKRKGVNMKHILLLVLFFVVYPLGNVPHDVFLKYWIAPSVLEVNGIPHMNVIGTAFQVNYKGKQFILTNKHICTVYGGKNLVINKQFVKVLAISKVHDLCLVSALKDVRGLSIGKNLSHIKPVWLIGHPRGLPTIIRQGNYLYDMSNFFPWLGKRLVNVEVLDVIAYGGNSGSPIVDYFGDVVGVLFGSYTGYHTEALIVPLEDINQFLKTRR